VTNVTVQRYEHHTDYGRVGQFLVDTYRPGDHHENWLQPRWEYMHYHPLFDDTLRIAFSNTGVWESDGAIVAVVHFEHTPGKCYFQVHPNFAHLKLEMVEYAEAYLNVQVDNDKREVAIWIDDFDMKLESIVRDRGYHLLEGVREP
jgi:hypothetical protein